MSYGLRCWAADGTLTLDTTDRIFRLHNVYPVNITVANQGGTISVPGMTTDGQWFVYCDTGHFSWVGADGFTWGIIDGYPGADYTTEFVVMRI